MLVRVQPGELEKALEPGPFWFPFTGTIAKVTVDLSGELIKDDQAAVRLVMAQQ